MRFILDENFPRKAAHLLESEGYEVFDIRGTSSEGASDEDLFRIAQEHTAVLLTTDKDFFHTIPHLFSQHCGIIVVALRQPNGPAILNKLQVALRFIQNFSLESNVIMITDSRIYSSRKSNDS